MWDAWARRWWKMHPNHNPFDIPSPGLDLVKHMIGCIEIEEVAYVFNSEDQDIHEQLPIYGAKGELSTYDYELWQHIDGRVEVEVSAAPVGSSYPKPEYIISDMIDKYYKVNFGYAYFRYGTVEFREFPALSLEFERDLLFWVNFCMWLLFISKEITWQELAVLGRMKDLCDQTETSIPNREYMWTALFGVLGGLNGGDPYYYAMAERFARNLYTMMKRRHDKVFEAQKGVFTDQMIKASEPMTLLDGDNIQRALEHGRIAGAQGFIHNLCLVVDLHGLRDFSPPRTRPESLMGEEVDVRWEEIARRWFGDKEAQFREEGSQFGDANSRLKATKQWFGNQGFEFSISDPRISNPQTRRPKRISRRRLPTRVSRNKLVESSSCM